MPPKPNTPEILKPEENEVPDHVINQRLSRAAEFAAGLLRPRDEVVTLDDLAEIREEDSKLTRIAEIDIECRGPSISYEVMGDVGIASRYRDPLAARERIKVISESHEESRPDLIILGGLVQDTKKRTGKSNRKDDIKGLSSMHTRFALAREFLDEALATGAKVVYAFTADDRMAAESYTLDVMQELLDQASPYLEQEKKRHDELGMSWVKVDALKSNSWYETHEAFQYEVAYPYCIRAGRPLKTASEMRKQTGGEVVMSEYQLLYELEERRAKGQRPLPRHKYLEQFDDETNQRLFIADDFDATLRTKGRKSQSRTLSLRSTMSLSAKTRYQNPLDKALKFAGEMAANGTPLGDHVLVFEQNEEIGIATGPDQWVTSVAGFSDARKTHGVSGRYSQTSDAARRTIVTRGRSVTPGSTRHEFTGDYVHSLPILNPEALEKASSLSDRTALVVMSDVQLGSITSAFDQHVKFLDLVGRNILSQMPTFLLFNGDEIHGHIYPDFPNESQTTGLMSIDSQEQAYRWALDGFFASLKTKFIRNIIGMHANAGNHQWNNGTSRRPGHGGTFTNFIQDEFIIGMMSRGVSKDELRRVTSASKAITTEFGDYVKTWTGMNYFGDYGVMSQHFPMERGGKGSGGAPIYQAHGHFAGMGEIMRGVDLAFYGHWHHPQYARFGNTTAVISGAFAGLSGYEWMRGYYPVKGAVVAYLGGGEPPVIDFVTEKTILSHKIKTGQLSDKKLREQGFETDEGFDPAKHGLNMPPHFPKSALQKAILNASRAASFHEGNVAHMR